MPTLTRWFVKSALACLALGLVAMVLQQWPGLSLPGLFAVALHLLTFGWLTQLIFGIALWMFPMYSKEQPRGPAWLGWGIYICLNLGLALRVVFEPQAGQPWAGWMLVSAALLQWLAGMGFIAAVWTRVRSR